MANDYSLTNTQEFQKYLAVLSNELSYVEDDSFRWKDAVGLLIIQLKNTDSLNKERKESHATQIQLTSEKEALDGYRKTEDFFPTLTLNSSFKSWRISVTTRMHANNIGYLSNNTQVADNWIIDRIQIRRRLLNDDGNGNGNPALHICYGEDLMPLREKLNVNDYLVIVKRKDSSIYEAFGIKSDIDLGTGKRMYLSSNSQTDSTTFELDGINPNYETAKRKTGGMNVLLYGVPGSGKSWTIQNEYCNDEERMERLVFHPDYTYSDFVGQILPNVSDGVVNYKFTEGPFTSLLKKAYTHPQTEYYLIIEEINRGNAPAIFGEVFQLLDRDDNGTSEYGITNSDIAKIVYDDPDHKVRIPSNMSIIGTMNTSDQNVFTLDTAFQRRWNMRLVENSFKNHSFSEKKILDTDVTWKRFCEVINNVIVNKNVTMTSSEDKRLGAYFVRVNDLDYHIEAEDDSKTVQERTKARLLNYLFAEKVLKYLWDDAFKFSRQDIFKNNIYKSLEEVVNHFNSRDESHAKGNERLDVFKQEIIDDLLSDK